MSKAEVSEAQIDVFERLLIRVLRAFFPKLKADDSKTDFFAVYKREADEFDKEFTKKYDEDLNTTLIFAGLFSAVTSAFVIDAQGNLQPDYNEQAAALLRLLLQNQIPGNPAASTADITSVTWAGPDPTDVKIQALLYASLTASMLAAFLAVLGKQWLNRYMRRRGGSAIEKCQDRQVKADGMEDWGFSIVMESLPLMLQAALLLLGCALSRYLWDINHVVALVNIVVTSIGVLLYIVAVLIASFSYACPYQTPFSLAVRYLVDLDQKHTRYLPQLHSWSESWRKRMSFLCVNIKIPSFPGFRSTPLAESADSEQDYEEDTELRCVNVDTEADLLVEQLFGDRVVELEENTMNTFCISWILSNSTDPEVMTSAIRWIPEVEWLPDMDNLPPLDLLIDSLGSCIDQSGAPLPEYDERIEATIKAIIQIYTCRCIRGESTKLLYDSDAASSLARRLHGRRTQILPSMLYYYCYEGLRDNIFPIMRDDFQEFSIPHLHLPWVCHILVQHVWVRRRVGGILPTDLPDFVDYCLSRSNDLPQCVIADCVTIVAINLGVPFHIQDIFVEDKTPQLDVILRSTFVRIHTSFRGKCAGVDPTIKAMQTLSVYDPAYQSGDRLRSKMSDWFLEVVRTTLTKIIKSPLGDDEKWKAAHLMLKIESRLASYQSKFDHRLGGVIAFLQHHLDIPSDQRRENHEESIRLAFLAIQRSTFFSHGDQIYNEKFLGWISSISTSPEYSEGLLKLVLEILANDSDERLVAKLPQQIQSQLSLVLRNIGERSPQLHETYEYTRIFQSVLRLGGWLLNIVNNHWQTLDYSTNDDHEFPNFLIPRFGNIVDLLGQVDDREVINAWLRFAWRKCDKLPAGVLPQIATTTAGRFEGEENKEVILGFETLPAAWLAHRSLPIDPVTWNEEQQEKFRGLVGTYLKSAWNRPLTWDPDFLGLSLEITSGQPQSFDSPLLGQIVEVTLDLCHIVGYEWMDREALGSWSKFVFTRSPYIPAPEIESAIMEVYRRGGQAAVDGVHAFVELPRDYLEQAATYARVAGERDVFDKCKYEKLVSMKSAFESLDYIWEKVATATVP